MKPDTELTLFQREFIDKDVAAGGYVAYHESIFQSPAYIEWLELRLQSKVDSASTNNQSTAIAQIADYLLTSADTVLLNHFELRERMREAERQLRAL